MSSEKKVFFYNGRSDLLYKTNFSDVYEYIENLEPWEETDGVVFDWEKTESNYDPKENVSSINIIYNAGL